MKSLKVGTSGWVYKDWKSKFYPKNIRAKDHLSFYCTQFNTVEVNATFYRLPTKNMVTTWQETAPEGFQFAIKGSRYISHIKRLKGSKEELTESVHRCTDPLEPLRNKMGPMLWQLPPTLHKDLALLNTFLAALPKEFDHAIEFRDNSWYDKETENALRKLGVCQVWVSSEQMTDYSPSTASFTYLRFHGLENGFKHDYTENELKPWVNRVCEALEAGKKCYVYFNNDGNANAPQNARTFEEMCSKRVK